MTSAQTHKSPRFALFCKTFAPDLERFRVLLDSIEKHGRGVPFVVSLPRDDQATFENRCGTGRFEIVHDEELLPRAAKRGWRNQQLIKLAFHRTKLADAWLWTDSDTYFIRDFGPENFVREGRVSMIASNCRHVLDDHRQDILNYLENPRSIQPVLLNSEDRVPLSPTVAKLLKLKDLVKAPSALGSLQRIQEFFGRKGPPVHYMPCAVWTADSLQSLEAFLESRYGWGFHDMIAFAPWEAVWVGEWELSRGAPGRYFIEPPMLHIREDATILEARNSGPTEPQLADRYLGIQLAERHQTLSRLSPTE